MFHASRYALEACERARARRIVDPELTRDHERGERILHVEAPGEADLERLSVDRETAPIGANRDTGAADHRVAFDAIRRHRAAGFRELTRPEAPVVVVDVRHDFGRSFEELALRGGVRFEGSVKIEMVARHVGQYADRKRDVADAVEFERVRADLHRDGLGAEVAHFGEKSLHVRREWRRIRERPTRAPELRAERSDRAGGNRGFV
jgi:hypothetical protein